MEITQILRNGIRIILFVFCIFLIFHTYCIFSKYDEFPTTMDTSIRVMDTLFPTVTLCSIDSAVNTAFINNNGSIGDFLPIIRPNVSLSEFVHSCSFNGKKCDFNEFLSNVADHYGSCFTFNFNTSKVLFAYRPGPEYGLRLLLNTRESGGGIHPLPETYGQNVPSGFATTLKYNTKVFRRSQRPYGICRDFALSDESRYTQEGCNVDCFQDQLSRECGCIHPFHPVFYRERPAVCDRRKPDEYNLFFDAITVELLELDGSALIEVYTEQIQFEQLSEIPVYPLSFLIADITRNLILFVILVLIAVTLPTRQRGRRMNFTEGDESIALNKA